jgi:hypothetical protein
MGSLCFSSSGSSCSNLGRYVNFSAAQHPSPAEITVRESLWQYSAPGKGRAGRTNPPPGLAAGKPGTYFAG